MGSSNAKDKYDLKGSNIVLPENLKTKIQDIADTFFSQRKKRLVITSGTRTASEQAHAMYNKMKAGENPTTLYKDKSAAKEIKKAFDENAKEPSKTAIDEMTKVIASQMEKGVYISRHLRGDGFDVRSKDMSAKDKSAFSDIVAKNKDLTLIKEGTPPHFHVQKNTQKPKVDSAEKIFSELKSNLQSNKSSTAEKNQCSLDDEMPKFR